MKVLTLGPGSMELAKSMDGWPENVEFVDDTVKHRWESIDCILAVNILQTYSYREVTKVIEGWMRLLKRKGEINLVVPSLEWAARQILLEDSPSPALQAHLFGPQTGESDTHRGGYTLLQLRDMCQRAGIRVTHARTGVYDIAGHEADMHSIRGVK